MPIEKAPPNPLPVGYVPPGGTPYKVQNLDSWISLAAKRGIDVQALIEFNFNTRDPNEVNWYLRRNVGCKKQTSDGQNWMFSADASPGIVYFPGEKKPEEKKVIEIKPAPSTVCPDELNVAKATLSKSADVANTILGPKATSDTIYWFALLYQFITQHEIEGRGALKQPCFMLHFIPIFYDTYVVAVNAFKNGSAIPAHWQDHFNMAGLITDPAQLVPWMQAVTKALILGVTAHIKGDMAPSLVKAYRSFSAKYKDVPSFDTFKPDFFELNKPIFDAVKKELVNNLINRGTGLATFGKKVDPDFATQAADTLKLGLDIDEIYKWREKAWTDAKKELGQ
jgi:hypothetical protein